MKTLNRNKVAIGGLLALSLVIGVVAQTQYLMDRGDAGRSGLQSQLNESPGRMLLRWFDPTRAIETVADNWETSGTNYSVVAAPPARWLAPSGDRLAADFTNKNPVTGRAPYLYAFLTPSATADNVAQIPANLSTFSWNFGVVQDQEFSLYVNLPSGPTNDASGNLFYPQQFFVYEITGVVNTDNPGQPFVDVVDTFLTGGGEVRLGNGGRPSGRLFKALGNSVSIRLLNTISRDSQGDLTETRTNAVVYADSAKLVRAVGESGSYTAAPVVAQYDGLGSTGQRRVFAARNEESFVQVGNEARTYKLGITSAFVHNGTKVTLAEPGIGGDIRRNVDWSWPVQRPTTDTESARTTYATDKVNWILASNRFRTEQAIPVDNRSVTATPPTLGWTVDSTTPTRFGVDFVTAPVVSGTPSERVRFQMPNAPEGQYRIQVWSPGPNSGFATGGKVEIWRSGFIIATVPVNFAQANFPGADRWITLAVNNVSAWDSSPAAPLEVRITNASDNTADVGTLVPADAVRFVRQSDLSVTATPAVARLTVGGNLRNMLYVPMENGRMYALQTNAANGNPTTPTVQWVYPPENLDGREDAVGIAQTPTGFGSSSPLHQRLANGRERIYFGTTNGRVYCLDAVTGDRVWSWPNDYPAATPVTGVRQAIVGGVTFAKMRQGASEREVIAVPTTNGRLYVLDADGNAADKTTTELLQYPDVAAADLGAITMTPVAGDPLAGATGNSLIIGAGANLYSLDLAETAPGSGTAVLNWQQDGNTGVDPTLNVPRFGGFGAASPLLISAANEALVSNVGPAIYVPATAGIYSLNLADGSVRWFTNEAQSNLTGSLGFSLANTFTPTGVRDYNPLNPATGTNTPGAGPGRPLILVPTSTGVARLYARPNDRTVANTATDPIRFLRTAGGYQGPGTRTTSIAFAGRGTGMHTLTDLGDLIGAYDDDFGFMYFADNAGYLYAFGDDPDLADGDQVITPGVIPINVDPAEPNNPAVADVSAIAQNAKVTLLIPSKYREIQRKIGANIALTAADVAAFALPPAQDAAMLRTAFEYGETLYVMVYDLPDTGVSSTGTSSFYRVQASLTLPGSQATPRALQLKALTSGSRAVGICEIQLQPSGQNGFAPGRGSLNVTVAATSINPRQAAGGGQLAIPTANYVIGTSGATSRNAVSLANPLALAFPNNLLQGARSSVGTVLNPADPENSINGSPLVFSNPANLPSNAVGAVSDASRVNTAAPENVNHGATAFSRLLVSDRSAISLLRGPTVGLGQVRFRPSDLVYPGLPDVFKPLDPTNYRNFEQLPISGSTNNSLDYPNLRRDSIVVRKSVTGAAQNPIFIGVTLSPPTGVDEVDYERDIASYTAGLTRTLVPTEFRMEIDVPRYQPPAFSVGTAPGYFGEMYVYVDANSQIPPAAFNAAANFAYRSFVQSTAVGVDEALSVGTKTVDLGALPGGSLYTANVAPQADANLFARPFALAPDTFFKTFSVLNEGNVNLLNVRTAKGYAASPGNVDPLRLFGGALNGATAMRGQTHLHTDLDPVLSTGRPEGKRILQKARVGDSEPTRLRLTPVARANPNLGVGDPGLLDLLDPRVAVSVPIGTPSGDYLNQIRVFEDTDLVSAQFPSIKRLTAGVDEAFSNPGFDLRFRVREARLTTTPTVRTRPMVDTGNAFTPSFNWENVHPSMIRDQLGNAYVAFASNRRTAAQAFGFDPRAGVLADTERDYGTTIYIARLGGGRPSTQANDVELWDNTVGTRWFTPATTAYPDSSLFPARDGFTYRADSVRFEYPSFPTGGISDPITGAANVNTYMTFVGSALREQDNVREHRLFILPISFRGGNLTLNLADARPMTYNNELVTSTGRIGRPSLVTFASPTGSTALVFFPETSSGQTQVFWAAYDPRDGWIQSTTGGRGFGGNRGTLVGSLGLTSSFESVSSVSAAARPSVRSGQVLQLAFTGKLRGRLNSDTFLSTLQLRANRNGVQLPTPDPTTRTPIVAWETRNDVIEWDPSAEMYWSQGAEIVATDDLIYGTGPNTIDLRAFRNGSDQSILVNAERQYDSAARLMTCRTIYGGTATVDLANGSVRFSDAVLPRGLRITLRYSPRYVRVNSGNGNARGVSMVLENRFQTETNYLADAGFQFNNSFGAFAGRASAAPFQRMWIAYTKTASTGSDTARIAYRTLRHGAALTQRVSLDSQGRIQSFRVNSGMVGGSFYQVDPVNGLIFFSPDNEGRTIHVTYNATRSDGTTFAQTDTVVVGWAGESGESTMPTDQGVNEGGISLAIDPLTADFRRQDRPGLMWMIWVSTRQGQSDVFLQTIAPRISPVPGS